jgi:hypothetical protein
MIWRFILWDSKLMRAAYFLPKAILFTFFQTLRLYYHLSLTGKVVHAIS